MVGEVIEFKPKEDDEYDPHLVGDARCMQCSHEFHTVIPAGLSWIDCPKCGGNKAFMKYPCMPSNGELEFRCVCGCTVFYIVPEAIRCCSCGADQRPFD